MRYERKLYLSFVCLAVIAAVLGVGIVYSDAKHRYNQSLRDRIVAVSATTAALLDPVLIQEVIEQKSENTTAFHELIEQLREARDANRSGGWYVKYLYLMTVYPDHPNQVVFVADAEEVSTEAVHLGDIDTQESHSHILEHLEVPYSPSTLITDPWGTWMSGFAPIFDSQGHYVATVGADVSGAEVQEMLNAILRYGFLGLIASVVLALIGARILTKKFTTSLKKLSDTVKEISEGNLSVQAEPEAKNEFLELSSAIDTMAKGLREKEKMKSSFARYVSRYVFDTIVKDETSLKVEGERRKITVLFSDIRQFTFLSEKLPPEMVVSLLNEYFETMIDIIFAHKGTLDKFLGDGMMVEFGAPLEDGAQELHALHAAVEMQQKVKMLCEKWKAEGKPLIQMGIGIHTGYAVVGNIGSEKRMEYTAIGDTVNVASRLEQATKTLGVDILISEPTYSAVKDVFTCNSLGPLAIPGRSEELHVYSVKPEKPFGSLTY